MPDSFEKYLPNLLASNSIDFQIFEDFVLKVELEKIIFYYQKIGSKHKIDVVLGKKNVIIWEDVWLKKPDIIISRIMALLGLGKKIPARVCNVKRVDIKIANEFLKNNHLQGSTNAKLKFGLFLEKKYFRLLDFIPEESELLLGVMTFSNAKKYYNSVGSINSFELIRYASLKDYTIQGGFSKLLKAFIADKKPGNIMTYIDKDWSDGENYLSLGFEKRGEIPPQYFCLNETLERQISAVPCDVMNSGSIKMIYE